MSTAMTRRVRATVIFGTLGGAAVLGALEKKYPQYLRPGGFPVVRAVAGAAGVLSVMSKKPKRAMYLAMLSMSMGAPKAHKFGGTLVR